MDFKINKQEQARFEKLYDDYKKLRTCPEQSAPKVIVNTPVSGLPSWEERINDPSKMLFAELESLKPHIEMGDDRVPTVRVQFGTAQIASAFGCDMYMPPDNLPCAKNHVLKKAQDVYTLKKPALHDGWFARLEEYTKFFKANLPEGVHIQHPDIQSAFNSGHLIRGNDIFTDFYEYPKELDALLSLVTEYMYDLTIWLKGMISNDKEWFFDWGALWKGAARISNCSAHMIDPCLYNEFILKYDLKFMEKIGGGRIHYCGTSSEVIDEFFKNSAVSGLDYDSQYHNLWDLSARAPKDVVLLNAYYNIEETKGQEEFIQQIEKDGWPRKNIILQLWAPDTHTGKKLLERVRSTF